MKFLPFAALLLALVAAPAWAGDDDAPSRFFDRYDADGDGRVTPEELGVGADVFRLLDRDGDGTITRADLGGPADYRPRPGPRDQGDGQQPGRGPGAGSGGPGKGGPGQAGPGRAGPGRDGRSDQRYRRLLAMDADKDGRITREEFTGPDELFGRLDANEDGAIDTAECRQAAGRGRQRGQGPGGQGPGGQGPGGQGPGGPGRGDGQGRGPGSRMLERLKQLDTDGDGRVSAAEYEGRIPFERLDKNGDGFLDAKDFEGRRGGERRGPGGGPGGDAGRGPGDRPDRQRMRDALKAMDTDGDGKVSKDEYTGPVPFERLDQNGDGFLDAADAPRGRGRGDGQGRGEGPGRGDGQRGRRGRGLTPQALKRFDQDGNGEVSRDEFPGSDERFDLLDTNADGVLTEADVAKPAPPPAPPAPPTPPAPPAPDAPPEPDVR